MLYMAANDTEAVDVEEEQGIVKAHYAVKSFRTRDGKPVYNGLPYSLATHSHLDLEFFGIRSAHRKHAHPFYS